MSKEREFYDIWKSDVINSLQLIYKKGYDDAKQELKREPLSEERLARLYLLSVDYDPYFFARQVEKAHGIGVDGEQ